MLFLKFVRRADTGTNVGTTHRLIWTNTVHYLNGWVPYRGHKERALDKDIGVEALRAHAKLKGVSVHHGASRIQ